MSSATVPAPPAAEPLSQMQRVVNIFVAPSKTFADLNRNPSWWLAWILLSVFALIFIYSIQKQVGFDQVSKNEIAASPKAVERMEKLSPEQRDRQMEISESFTKYFSYGVPVFILIGCIIIAAVLMATYNFGMGAEIKFGVALAVVFWAYMPGILRSLLAAISLFAGADPEGFNIRNPVATNLGFFISRTDHPALYSLLSDIDVFSIWICVLMAIGFATVSKVKRSTSMSVIFGWYVVVSLLGAGWVALFS